MKKVFELCFVRNAFKVLMRENCRMFATYFAHCERDQLNQEYVLLNSIYEYIKISL